MKKQYNYYMDSDCKKMIEHIRNKDSLQVSLLNDSQIVEYLIREKARSLGYVKTEEK